MTPMMTVRLSFDRAFKTLHDLTDGVRTALLRNRVFESLNAVVEDADVDAIDDEITLCAAGRSEPCEPAVLRDWA